MELVVYSNLMKLAGKEKYFSVRKSVTLEALENGIKPTAKKYCMSKNTVKTWMRRFQEEGNDGLYDQRKGPNHIPHKTPKEVEEQIINIRRNAPCYGAMRFKYFFNLKASKGNIQRILKDESLGQLFTLPAPLSKEASLIYRATGLTRFAAPHFRSLE